MPSLDFKYELLKAQAAAKMKCKNAEKIDKSIDIEAMTSCMDKKTYSDIGSGTGLSYGPNIVKIGSVPAEKSLVEKSVTNTL